MPRFSALTVVALAITATTAPAQERAAATITAADIADRVGRLAHDSMRGRFTPSPEL
jgi:hypothetical protein